MSDDHTTTVDRLRQFRDAKTYQAIDRIQEAQRSDAAARGTFPAGVRVLDLVSGQEGVVLDPARTVTPVSTLVTVRLDRGDLVIRPPAQLLARPTPPSV